MKHTTASERRKYRKMWTEVPAYRQRSPGEVLVPIFLQVASWTPGDTLIDLGAGPGKAGLWLEQHGFKVTLLDLCKEGPVAEARHLPFIEANLWQLPKLEPFDWVYCCDVMEHLPPERIDAVFDAMVPLARKGLFFQIALFPHEVEGETLHLTLQPAEWWKQHLAERWHIKMFATQNDPRIIALVEPT